MLGYYFFHRLAEGFFRISSREEVITDLIIGRERALLFDTGFGFADLPAAVARYTSLPLTVVNSHGHLDHTCGNFRFSQPAFLHEDDTALCLAHNAYEVRRAAAEAAAARGALPSRFDAEAYAHAGVGGLAPLREGDALDLGGVALEVVALPGHTAGSVGLLCKKEGLLYVGDAMSPHTWLFFPESGSLSTYISTLRHAMTLDFDRMVHAHTPRMRDKNDLAAYLDCAETLDFARGTAFETPFAPRGGVRLCVRRGYSASAPEEPGYASLALTEDKLD